MPFLVFRKEEEREAREKLSGMRSEGLRGKRAADVQLIDGRAANKLAILFIFAIFAHKCGHSATAVRSTTAPFGKSTAQPLWAKGTKAA